MATSPHFIMIPQHYAIKPGVLYGGEYESGKVEKPQLFDLVADVGEKTNVAVAHPEVVAKLEAAAEKERADLGDSLTNRSSTNDRPPTC